MNHKYPKTIANSQLRAERKHELLIALSMMFPILLVISGGFFLHLTRCLFRARRYFVFGLSTAVFVLLVGAALRCGSDDPRSPSAAPFLVPGGALAYVVFRRFLRETPPDDVVFIVGVVSFVMAAGTVFPSPLSMHPLDNQAAVSPDGRYTARLVYSDGMTYGYYFVCIKSNSSLEMWRGADEITEAAAEGVTSVDWKGSDRLVIEHEAGIGFVQQDRKWRDVGIDYDPLAAPKQ